MTTRHVSAQNDYPFHPVSDALRPVALGILDVYFVIQGQETGIVSEESSSSAQESDQVLLQTVYLISYLVTGPLTKYTFRAFYGNRYWDMTFSVPNTGGELGQVNNDDGSDCRAVLIYNSDLIMQATADISLQVEPGRAQFHTEQVDSMSFFNIWRCSGVEDASSSLSVLEIGSPAMELDMVDGHNTQLAYESSLEIIGGVGLGKGIIPDAGNTSPECQSSSEAETDLEDVVTVINGILPTNGNIPVRVEGSIGLQRAPGRLELLIRNQ
jgi:hypothetical protein